MWSYAGAWEFEHNGNAAAARTLMQRGLRMCKSSQQLWLEYFRMELMYAHKLGARRRLLGIDTSGEFNVQIVVKLLPNCEQTTLWELLLGLYGCT